MLRVRQLNTAALFQALSSRALMRGAPSPVALAAASITAPAPTVSAMKAELERLDPSPE